MKVIASYYADVISAGALDMGISCEESRKAGAYARRRTYESCSRRDAARLLYNSAVAMC